MGGVNGNYKTGVELGFSPRITFEPIGSGKPAPKKTQFHGQVEAGAQLNEYKNRYEDSSGGLAISRIENKNRTQLYTKAAVGVTRSISEKGTAWVAVQGETSNVAQKSKIEDSQIPAGYGDLAAGLEAKHKSLTLPFNAHARAGTSFCFGENSAVNTFVEVGHRNLSVNESATLLKDTPELVANSPKNLMSQNFKGIGAGLEAKIGDADTSFKTGIEAYFRSYDTTAKLYNTKSNIQSLPTMTGSDATIQDAHVSVIEQEVNMVQKNRNVIGWNWNNKIQLGRFGIDLNFFGEHVLVQKNSEFYNFATQTEERNFVATNVNGGSYNESGGSRTVNSSNINTFDLSEGVFSAVTLGAHARLNDNPEKLVNAFAKFNMTNYQTGFLLDDALFIPAFNSFQLGLNAKF